ncbi:MAG TPA: DUF6691 family protein [Cyclobacteriaceae bacterium]|jgi:uncharacterized membrane protein YedE/YeeE|nr:MAG: transporter [Bacteroidota bacterium]
MSKGEVVAEFRKLTDTDPEGRAIDSGLNESRLSLPWWHDIKFLIAGAWFGLLLVKSEVISWFRIQEMFRLQSFHMYGIIGSAVLVGMLSLWIIRRFGIRTIYGEPIVVADKKFHKGNIYGSLLFGFGWAMTGACPGPLYAQLGTGMLVIGVTIISALAGTWVYGLLRSRLPH